MNKCPTHPQYKGIHKPRKTKKFPKRCPKCIKVWEQAQSYDIGLRFYCAKCDKEVTGDYSVIIRREYGQEYGDVIGACPSCPNEYDFGY